MPPLAGSGGAGGPPAAAAEGGSGAPQPQVAAQLRDAAVLARRVGLPYRPGSAVAAVEASKVAGSSDGAAVVAGALSTAAGPRARHAAAAAAAAAAAWGAPSAVTGGAASGRRCLSGGSGGGGGSGSLQTATSKWRRKVRPASAQPAPRVTAQPLAGEGSVSPAGRIIQTAADERAPTAGAGSVQSSTAAGAEAEAAKAASITPESPAGSIGEQHHDNEAAERRRFPHFHHWMQGRSAPEPLAARCGGNSCSGQLQTSAAAAAAAVAAAADACTHSVQGTSRCSRRAVTHPRGRGRSPSRPCSGASQAPRSTQQPQRQGPRPGSASAAALPAGALLCNSHTHEQSSQAAPAAPAVPSWLRAQLLGNGAQAAVPLGTASSEAPASPPGSLGGRPCSAGRSSASSGGGSSSGSARRMPAAAPDGQLCKSGTRASRWGWAVDSTEKSVLQPQGAAGAAATLLPDSQQGQERLGREGAALLANHVASQWPQTGDADADAACWSEEESAGWPAGRHQQGHYRGGGGGGGGGRALLALWARLPLQGRAPVGRDDLRALAVAFEAALQQVHAPGPALCPPPPPPERQQLGGGVDCWASCVEGWSAAGQVRSAADSRACATTLLNTRTACADSFTARMHGQSSSLHCQHKIRPLKATLCIHDSNNGPTGGAGAVRLGQVVGRALPPGQH
jgi:hypothetical protein